MPEVELSYSAEELLGVLAKDLPPSAPAGSWLRALAAHDAGLAAAAAEGDLPAVMAESTTASAPDVTGAQVAAQACRHAEQRGAAVAKAFDVADALVALAREVVAPAEPEPVPEAEPEPVPEAEPEPEPKLDGTERTRTFRVFVSSTFDDFAVERNVLRTRVWPVLRELCREHHARFLPIDLRWGVSEEAALDQQTMNICLGEIERCQQVTPRPDFLVLLGNRYGWRPPPPQIPASEYDALLAWLKSTGHPDGGLLEEWYRRDDNADPPEYFLRRRTGVHEASEEWGPVERRLTAALAVAAADPSTDLSAAARRRYTYSATAQEIAHGALDVADADQAVAFVREIAPHADSGVEPASWSTYVDDDQSALTDLKQQVRDRLGPRVIAPPEPLPFGDAGLEYGPDYLTTFAEGIRDALASSIRAELEQPRPTSTEPAVGDPLEEEVRAHRRFAEERRAHFTGRREVLADINHYLDDDADPQPLVVHGEGGCGKSSLMAEVLRPLESESGSGLVLARFVGATPGSADGRTLLTSLCEELGRVSGDTTPVPTDLTDLASEFARRLTQIAAERPVRVLVDSLDQLGGPARSLTWIPRSLPPGVRMVLSTRSGQTLDPLRHRARLLELGGLERPDGEGLLTAWLESAVPRRTLQPGQREAVLDAFEASRGNPLYLRLAFEEARRWVSDEPPELLAIGVRELIRQNLLHRLASEDNHGHELVSTVLGYLAASRDGLAEDELTELLARDVPLYRHVLLHSFHVPEDLVDCAESSALRPADVPAAQWVADLRARAAKAGDGVGLDLLLDEVVPAGAGRPRPGPELPVVLWSRLAFDLAPYLTERRTENGNLLSFYHRELQEVAAAEFAVGEVGRDLHSRMADYFRELADPAGNGTWTGSRGPGRRGLSELPHHLTAGERWNDVEAVLTDFTFLEQKVTYVGVIEQEGGERLHTGVFALEADYDEALAEMRGQSGPVDRLRLIVTAVDLGEGLVVRCPHCNTRHPFDEAWRGHAITCPNPDCGGPLRVNEFLVTRS